MAAHAVLTDLHWLREITRFQDGLPGLLDAFQRQEHTRVVANATPIPRTRLVHAAIMAQDLRILAMLERLADQPLYANDFCFDDALETAAREGALRSLQWLVERHHRQKSLVSTSLLLNAVVSGCGDVATAAWLASQYPESTHHVSSASIDTAASLGHLDILQWLHESNRFDTAFQSTAMDHAAAHGQIKIVQYLHDHREEGCSTKAPIDAAERGHLAVLQLLWQWYPQHFVSTPQILDTATVGIEPHRLVIVRFLHETIKAPCTIAAIDNAAGIGNFEVISYLLAHRVEGFSWKALVSAARAGHIDVLRLLLTHRQAEERPDIDISMDLSRAITAATLPGHTEIVRLLLEANKTRCRPNVGGALRVAAAWGREDIIRLLLEHGEWFSLLDAMSQAFYHEHHTIVELLQQAMKAKTTKSTTEIE